VGKTEVARRLARLAQAPFIKVEASKFTEVGYVGRDVESIVRDLTETGVSLVLEEQKHAVQAKARDRAEERLLDALLPPPPPVPSQEPAAEPPASETREKLRRLLHGGSLDDREVELDFENSSSRPRVSRRWGCSSRICSAGCFRSRPAAGA